jgi:hypothetical protein
VREREAAGRPAPHASHRRVQPAIPQNEFPEALTQRGRQTFAGFYFFHQYNARLVATEAALVHRYLTYLSRACKARLSKKPTQIL